MVLFSYTSCPLAGRPSEVIAVSIAFNNASSLNGLSKYSTAPALSAWARVSSSPCAVMKITGIGVRSQTRRRCSSRPFIPGMRTSRIRQSVSARRGQLKNSSADAKVMILNPTERIRPLSDSRIESSSSTTDMSGTWDMRILSLPTDKFRLATSATAKLLYFGIGARRGSPSCFARVFQSLEHPHQLRQRLRLHFLHDLSAMHFDRDLAGAEVGGDLLVEHAGNDAFHHLALTRRQRF